MVDMIRLQHDYVSIPARTLVPFLKGLKSQDPLVERARSKLLNWDFELASDSVEAGIYVAFERNVLRKIEELKVPSIAREYLTIGMKKTIDMLLAPDGDFGDDPLSGRDEFLLESLSEGVAGLRENFGNEMMDWVYGQN